MTLTSTRSAYELGILRQAETVQAVVDAGLEPDTRDFLASVPRRFDRIVMTGMGSGPWASYPAYLRLLRAGVPVWVLESSELLENAIELLDARTLLWVTSQSGESAEVVALVEALTEPRPVTLAVVNNLNSPLAAAADVVIPLRVGSADDQIAGTGTFANSIVVNALAVDAMLGTDEATAFGDAGEAIAAYTASWDAHVTEGVGLGLHRAGAAILGRGASLAAVRTGALLIKEAGKAHAEAFSVSEFRHGPVELVRPDFVTVIASGEERTRALSARLAADVAGWGGAVVWLGEGASDAPGARLSAPSLRGEARAIAELLPLQMLSVAAARSAGLEPGVFVNARRVTRVR
jgi:glucosamine--fructose-6-phosphate aminotransferase (isomerizing)